MVVTALGVTFIPFVSCHAVPTDPIAPNPIQIVRQRLTIIEAFCKKRGLDNPLSQQYLTFLGNLTQGEIGTSVNTRRAKKWYRAPFIGYDTCLIPLMGDLYSWQSTRLQPT
jgi:ABC-type dipeptide/oligopeptide/nickel transport system permease component